MEKSYCDWSLDAGGNAGGYLPHCLRTRLDGSGGAVLALSVLLRGSCVERYGNQLSVQSVRCNVELVISELTRRFQGNRAFPISVTSSTAPSVRSGSMIISALIPPSRMRQQFLYFAIDIYPMPCYICEKLMAITFETLQEGGRSCQRERAIPQVRYWM